MSQIGWIDPEPASEDRLRGLRRERDRAVIIALACLVGTLVGVVPGAVRRHRMQAAANAELVALQVNIAMTQDEIRKGQAEMLRVQKEIAALVHRNP